MRAWAGLRCGGEGVEGWAGCLWCLGDTPRHYPPQDSEFSDAEAAPGGEENAPVYCVCRKPDINCFMM